MVVSPKACDSQFTEEVTAIKCVRDVSMENLSTHVSQKRSRGPDFSDERARSSHHQVRQRVVKYNWCSPYSTDSMYIVMSAPALALACIGIGGAGS